MDHFTKNEIIDSSKKKLNSSIFNDHYEPFSDLYFKYNQTLPGELVSFKNFTQTDDNYLIRRNFPNNLSNFVPFYQTNPNYNLESTDSQHVQAIPTTETSCYSLNSFDSYFPIFMPLFKNAHFKPLNIYNNHHLLNRRNSRQTLDEVIPLMNEMYQNIDNRSTQNQENEFYLERNILLLDPLFLDLNERRTKMKKTRTEHNKIVRITIIYVMAFFALALITFFSLYLL